MIHANIPWMKKFATLEVELLGNTGYSNITTKAVEDFYKPYQFTVMPRAYTQTPPYPNKTMKSFG